MMKFNFVLCLCFFSSLAFAINSETSFCEKFYKDQIQKPDYKVYTVFESKTLCGFEMNKNTISFNKETIAPNQNLSDEEKSILNPDLKWINVFSKDQTKEVVSQSIFNIGLLNPEKCLVSHPLKKNIQCPYLENDLFGVFAKAKNEEFKKKKI